jgi:hypothetical protein
MTELQRQELQRLLATYERYGGQDIVPLGEGIAVWRHVFLDCDDPWLPYLARAVIENTPEGPRCIDLRLVQRPGGPPLTPEGLRRVPLGRVVRGVEHQQHVLHTMPRASLERLPPYMRQAIGEGGPVWGASGPASEQARRDRAAYRRALARQRAQGRRWQLDEARLRKVAAVYRQAVAVGRWPTAAVQEHFGLATRGQAARWVQRARQEGHLAPAPGRRMKGERATSSGPGGPARKP